MKLTGNTRHEAKGLQTLLDGANETKRRGGYGGVVRNRKNECDTTGP